jgi:hypothetical protein
MARPMIGSYILLLLLESTTRAGVVTHDDQDNDAEREIDKVKHVWLRFEEAGKMMRLPDVSGPYRICDSA